MVMHARKTPRISDGYFEKHQAHPYQNSSKYSKTSSSSSTTQQQQQLGGSSATSSSSDHHRSYSDSHHHRLSRDSPNNGTYHSSHHHHHRGSGGGGGSSAEGISPLLDDSGGGNRKGYGGGKIHSKEREIRDYKRDKYSDCSRSPKDSALSGGGKQRTARGPSSTSSSSTSTSALNVNNDMSLVNAGCSGGGLLAERDRTNHDRSSLLAVDQQMLADGGVKSKSGGSRGDRGGKQQQGSGVHNNCLDKHSIGESRHLTSNASTSQSQSQSTGNSQSQSTTASASATTNTNAQSQSSGGSSSTSSSRVGDWSEHLSSSGKRYYYNCKTEVSQWEKPREWLLMDRESGNNSQRSSVGESGRSDRGDREGGGSSRTADRDRSDGGRQYRDSRDSRDGGRDRGDGGGYNRGGSTRHTHDKHSNSRQSSSTNASASSTSAPGDRQTSSSSTANSSNSTSSNNNAALAIVGASRSTGDKSHQHHHSSTSSSAAARQHCSGASGGTGDSASRDIALDIGQKDTSGRLSRIGKGVANYHHQQMQQQEVVQDMDISPGDSTPTSETSPSNPNQPTNAVNSAVPTTAVLLANALPRLTSHPLTPSTAMSADHASTAMTTTPALTAAMATDLGATTSDVAMLEAGGAGGVSLQDGGATPTHSELPDMARGETAMSGQQQQVIGINGGVVIMPGSSLQAVIPIISNCSHQSTSATASMITSLPTSCAASIVRSAASTSVVGSGNSGNHLVTASLAQHVRDDLLAHVRGWPADIVERQAVKCAEEAALVGGVQCARVSAELKTARAIVRLTEIQATLQEQRILFLRQQIKMLEELKSQNSFMSDDT